MKTRLFLLLAMWSAVRIAGAAEVALPIEDERYWWSCSPAEPKNYWGQVVRVDGRPVLRYRNEGGSSGGGLSLQMETRGKGEYVFSGRVRILTGQENVYIHCSISNYKKGEERPPHSTLGFDPPIRIPHGKTIGEWYPFSMTFTTASPFLCDDCHQTFDFDGVKISFTLQADDSKAMTQDMMIELDSLKISGPGAIELPQRKLPPPKPPKPPITSPGNRIAAATALAGKNAAKAFVMSPDFTSEEVIRLNPDFRIRLLAAAVEEDEIAWLERLRFPPPLDHVRGALLHPVVIGSTLYGFARSPGGIEFAAYSPESGEWRSIRRKLPWTKLLQAPPSPGVTPQCSGEAVWFHFKPVRGIRLSDGADFELPVASSIHRPAIAALPGHIFYLAADGRSIIDGGGDGSGRDAVNFAPGAEFGDDWKINGIWSMPESGMLLVDLGSRARRSFLEFDPVGGVCRLKRDGALSDRLLQTPFGRYLVSRDPARPLVAVDPGAGLPFAELASPLFPKRPGGPPSRWSMDSNQLAHGRIGAYFLVGDNGRLTFAHLAAPADSRILHGIAGDEIHPVEGDRALVVVSGKRIWRVEPAAGWGEPFSLDPAAGVAVESREVAMANAAANAAAAAAIPLEQGIVKIVPSIPELFDARWEAASGGGKQLRFTARPREVHCSVTLEFDPALTGGKAVDLFFTPKGPIPGLQIIDASPGPILTPDRDGRCRSAGGLAVQLILPPAAQATEFTLDRIARADVAHP